MIPVFLNPAAGQAESLRHAIAEFSPLELRETRPDAMTQAVRAAIEAGAARVVAAGGDGTVAAVAAAVAGTSCELAVIPGGTLNHFARDHGIPTDVRDACALASAGANVTHADAARINGRLFLNTSSVGVYANYVRTRNRLEPRLGYRVGSLLAAVWTFARVHPFTVCLEVEGVEQVYTTPQVLIAVGERELRVPTLGKRAENGRRGLHVMVVRSRTRARLIALSLGATARGTEAVSRTAHLDSWLVTRCRIEQRHSTVAVDGEILKMPSPLEYELCSKALRLVTSGSAKQARYS